MMETRRRASVGSRRDFFHLVGSPIRTHKMSFDFADMQAGSPTQLRAPETPPPVNGLLRMVDEFPYISVQGHKKQIVPKNEQDPRDGTLIGFYGHSFGDADDYDDDEDDDHEPTSAMDVESAGVSGPLMLDARMAGIPLYMSNWFEADAAALAMAARAPAIKDTLKPHLRVNMADVAIGRVIGEGAFGKVFKAVWKNRAVAVKVLIRQDLTADVVHEFESEVKIMSYLHHDNICMLLGACLEPTSRALVIELVEHGSLWGVLRTRRSVLTDQMRAKFALDTARGMSYLHNFNLPILHRDMKSPNLLVEHDFSIKISDFGLARVKAQIQTMTGNCGTVQWMAPEVLGNQKYTEKADVFSFGIVMWEIFTGKCPYDGMTQIQAALSVLNQDVRPVIPRTCPRFFTSLIRHCWKREPSMRPSFAEIVRAFEQNHIQ